MQNKNDLRDAKLKALADGRRFGKSQIMYDRYNYELEKALKRVNQNVYKNKKKADPDKVVWFSIMSMIIMVITAQIYIALN